MIHTAAIVRYTSTQGVAAYNAANNYELRRHVRSKKKGQFIMKNSANDSIRRRLSAVKAERAPAPITAADLRVAAAAYLSDLVKNDSELSDAIAAKRNEYAAKKALADALTDIAKRRLDEETAAAAEADDEECVDSSDAAAVEETAAIDNPDDAVATALAAAADDIREKFGGEPTPYRIAFMAAKTARSNAAAILEKIEELESKRDSAAVRPDDIAGGDDILVWMRWQTAADLEKDAAEVDYGAKKEAAAKAKGTAAKVAEKKDATDAEKAAAKDALTAANEKVKMAKVKRDAAAANAEKAAAVAPALGFGVRVKVPADTPNRVIAAVRSLLDGVIRNLPNDGGVIREVKTAVNIFGHRELILAASRAVVRRTAKNCISREGTATQWAIYYDTAAKRWEAPDVADMVSAAAECFTIAAAPVAGIAKEAYSAAVMHKYAAIAGKMADGDTVARAAVMNIARRQTGSRGITETDKMVDAAELEGYAARFGMAKEIRKGLTETLTAAKRELNAARAVVDGIEREISKFAAVQVQNAAVSDDKLASLCRTMGMDVGEARRRRVAAFEEAGTAIAYAAAAKKSAAGMILEKIKKVETANAAVKEADAAVRLAEEQYLECASRRRQKLDSAAEYDSRITENENVTETRAAIIERVAAARAAYGRAVEAGDETAAAEAVNAACMTGYAAVNAYLADMRAIRAARNPAAIDLDDVRDILVDYRDVLGGDVLEEAAAAKRKVLLEAIPAAKAEMTAAQLRVLDAMVKTCGETRAAARLLNKKHPTVCEHVAAIADIIAVKIAEVAGNTELAQDAAEAAAFAAYDAKVYAAIAAEARKDAARAKKMDNMKKNFVAAKKSIAAAALIDASGADAKARARRRVISVIAAMPPKMREITEKLAAGMTIRAAEKELNRSHATAMEAKKAAATRIIAAIHEELPEIADKIDLNAATIKEILDMLA